MTNDHFQDRYTVYNTTLTLVNLNASYHNGIYFCGIAGEWSYNFEQINAMGTWRDAIAAMVIVAMVTMVMRKIVQTDHDILTSESCNLSNTL